jgi:hypothetical protein
MAAISYRHKTGQFLRLIPLVHAFHHFVFQPLGGFVAYFKLSLYLHDRNPVLILCHDIHPKKVGSRWNKKNGFSAVIRKDISLSPLQPMRRSVTPPAPKTQL